MSVCQISTKIQYESVSCTRKILRIDGSNCQQWNWMRNREHANVASIATILIMYVMSRLGTSLT